MRPGYGVEGLLDELDRYRRSVVVLQERDWDPDGPNSPDFFLADPRLSAWLRGGYVPAGRLHNFQLWTARIARDDAAVRSPRLCSWRILALGVLLRGLFLTADPPWHAPVGITWHDEGPWVHNARNRALFGQWSLDRWNPMYLTPVFTGLEYASFSTFGVGTWQARLVSVAMGPVSVVALALGVAALAGRRAGLIARGAACDELYLRDVEPGRAHGSDHDRFHRPVVDAPRPMAGLARHVGPARRTSRALLAFFTKAAAAFFVGALGLEALLTVWLEDARRHGPGSGPRCTRAPRCGLRRPGGLRADRARSLRASVLAGVPVLQLADVRDSQTGLHREAFLDRISWVPIIHDFFTRQ